MTDVGQPVRICPRCRYDLRAATAPRCPECGLGFPFEDWDAGVLRDPQPTHIVLADLLNPLEILWAAARDTLAVSASPGWRTRTLALRGPVTPAIVGMLGGLTWLWLLSCAAFAAATMLHTAASPHLATIAALRVFGPQVVLASVCGALVPTLLAGGAPHAWPGRRRLIARVRLTATLLPGFAAHIVIPMAAGALALPQALDVVAMLAAVLVALPTVRVLRRPAQGTRLEPGPLLVGGLFVLGGMVLAARLMPGSVEPPVWLVGG